MLHFPRWKVWGVVLLCLVGVLMAVPSFVPPQYLANAPGFVRNTHINLGLDLAGGSQLLLEAQTGDVARQRVEAMEDTMRSEMRRSSIQISEVSTANNQLSFVIRDPAKVAEATRKVREQIQPGAFGGTQEWEMEANGPRIVLRPTDAGLRQAIDQAMDNARTVIDRRINALGTLEPTIIRQGANRILVQVPGLQDPEALKQLIGRTARLEFKMVDHDATQEQVQSGRPPVGSQILPTSEGGRIAVYRRALIVGEMIADARQSYDQQDGTPNVTLSFDNTGSRRFARATQENVGKSFAIILDGVVLSNPVIREPILGGTATISGGNFTVQTANELAISLRSG
ncbi:MAG: preprotein translocase subunit SecD, partial [Sphingomonadales bacterium]|nr:preprotein translocase subunit SecD [Sphingomonadales bacterium]